RITLLVALATEQRVPQVELVEPAQSEHAARLATCAQVDDFLDGKYEHGGVRDRAIGHDVGLQIEPEAERGELIRDVLRAAAEIRFDAAKCARPRRRFRPPVERIDELAPSGGKARTARGDDRRRAQLGGVLRAGDTVATAVLVGVGLDDQVGELAHDILLERLIARGLAAVKERAADKRWLRARGPRRCAYRDRDP